MSSVSEPDHRDLSPGSAPVAVVGLGHVGLPMALLLIRAGHRVLGFDRDGERLAALARGRSPLAHLAVDRLGTAFEPTADPERLADCGAVVLCLPTPIATADRRPDLSALQEWSERLHGLEDGDRVGGARRLLLCCSTVPPGATRRLFVEPLGARFDVAVSPEREDPGSGRDAAAVPRVVGASRPAALERATRFLAELGVPVHPVSSPEVAEASKLWENLYRSTNIALAAELERLLEANGIDPVETLEAAATKPFGFAPFHAGPGAGGPCIPEVARFLGELGDSALLGAVDDVHQAGGERLLQRLDRDLGERSIRPASARVLVVGVAYKPGVTDVRNAPGAGLVERLAARGNEVAFVDPLVKRLGDRAALALEASTADAEIARFDAVVLCGPPPAGIAPALARSSRLALDPRGYLRRASQA